MLASWSDIHASMPIWEEHLPLRVQREFFGLPVGSVIPYVDVRLANEPPPVRSWFFTHDRAQLLQVQPDAFVHNWLQGSQGHEYPRYPALRTQFEDRFSSFLAFVATHALGEVRAFQCEVTYVNLIDLESYAEHEILARPTHGASDAFLPAPESSELAVHYLMEQDGAPTGRLHIQCSRALRDGKPHMRLSISARGAPRGHTTEAIMAWLDLGREWVVRGFTSFTSTKMHDIWKRRA
jgi:uncharacterized protein (TIGR04255 family)